MTKNEFREESVKINNTKADSYDELCQKCKIKPQDSNE
jgi:hypothetical protein